MEKEMTRPIERETKNHFCPCDDLSCVLNPNNPINSTGIVHNCDPCIRKNLKAREIPSCFFLLVNKDMNGVEDFTINGFVEFYLKNRRGVE
jgi:Domain of unknown function (DUF6485)